MARGTPSLLALLGLLAVAGYQNREKLGEMLKQATGSRSQEGGSGDRGAGGGILSDLGSLFSDLTAGGTISDGLKDLLDGFTQSGQREVADSWVREGSNDQLREDQLEGAIGSDTIDRIARETGLSREEVLARLTRSLPNAVDGLTPQGRVPTDEEAAHFG